MPTSPPISSSELKNRLLEVHTTLEARKSREIWVNAAFVVLIWAISLVLIEHVAYLAPLSKTLLLLLMAGICAAAILVGRQKLSPTPFIEFYRAFSRNAHIPALTYALDLEKNTVANARLVEAAIFKNLELVEPELLNTKLEDFLAEHPITNRLKTKRLISGTLLILAIITGYSFSAAGIRFAQFWIPFQKPNPFLFTVTPGSETLEQGSEFVVNVEFVADIPEKLSLFVKTPVEEQFRQRGMDALGALFTSAPIELNTNLSYYIEMDGFISPTYEVEVQLRPRLSTLTAAIIPPAYTRLDTVKVTYPFAQIEGPQGSQILVAGKVNKPVDEFLVESTEFQRDVFVDANLTFKYAYSIKNPDTLRVKLTDANNLQNRNQFRFTVSPIADNFPYVELVEPSGSFEQVDPTEIDMLYRANDDYGLTRAALHYELRKAFVEIPQSGKLPLERPVLGAIQNYGWNISELNLKPKDELTFWIEVTDNDAYNGVKSSVSDRITLTVPSLIDYFEDIGEQEDEVETDLEDISESFDEMQQQYDLFKEQLKETPDQINYEQQRQLQEVQKQQEQIEKRIEELNEAFKEIKEELSESNMLSEETMEAYKELQELMEEIDDPAFKEALQKLQEQMQTMSPEQLREALENAEFNEELYKERLERTLELFKQLKLNSDLEKLAQTYEDLARQEEEALKNEENRERTQQNQSSLEQTKQLEKQLEDLSQNTSEKNREIIEELQEQSNEELDAIKKELEERIIKLQEQEKNSQHESPEQGDEGDKQDGDKQGEQQQNQPQQPSNVQKKFKQLAADTRNAMQQMAQQQMNINIAGLQYILYSLLNVSIEQEDLVTFASVTETRSPAYVEYAREQKTVEDIFSTLSDSLFQLSKQSPQFSNQINEKKLEVEKQLVRSLQQMAERNQAQASVATRQALGGINEIAYLLANLLEQLQNQSNGDGSGGGGSSMGEMMKQMEQMGQSQQQINQQIQEMINDMQGERLTQDQMERLNQLSRQQNQIRKQMQEMQRSGQLDGGNQLGSQMERMIEQMEETINDLRGGSVDPTLIERQQNILSRMLEAEKAMQERDEEEKREGTTARETPPSTPPEMTLEELEQQIRNRLNDPNFTKYSTDYQRLIEKYFELLKNRQEREIQ